MSKLFYLALPALALAMLYGVWRVHREASSLDADVLMERIEEEMARTRPNLDTVMREIDLALELTRASGDTAKEVEILTRRGDINRQLQRLDQARADYQYLLSEYIPGDRNVGIRLATLEFRAGEHERALTRLDSILEDNPTSSWAYRTRAEFLIEMADMVLEDAAEVCQGVLDDAEADRALELTQRLTVRDDADLRRAAMLEEVNAMYPGSMESERRLYNGLVRQAGILYDNAYADLARSLDSQTDSRGITSLLRLLLQSGRLDDAADFGVANLRWLLAGNYRDSIELLARTLHEAGRDDYAVLVVRAYGPKNLSPQFLPEWLEIAYNSERWPEVQQSAGRLRNSKVVVGPLDEHRSYSLFFQGIALTRQGHWQPALAPIDAYVNLESRIEPVPGALWLAEAARAQCLEQIGGRGRLREAADALASSLELRDRASGEEWLHVVELLEQNGGSRDDLEHALTRAMAAAPDHLAELEPKWRDVAQARMDQARLNIQRLRDQVSQRTNWVPNQDVGAYALFLLAEHYASEEQWIGAYSACRQVLDLAPHFPPALDLYVTACEEVGKVGDAIDALLERLEYLGDHDPTAARLRSLRDRMTSAQLRELMRLDPRRAGLYEMVRWLLEQGRVPEALAGLESHAASFEPEGLMLYGRALALNGRGAEALEVLGRVPTDDPVYAETFGVILHTAIALDDAAALEATLERLAVPSSPVGDLLVPALDELLLGGQFHPARQLAEFLDSDAATRSGQNLMRLAAIHLRTGELDLAREDLERAYAFQPDGGPALGRVVAAVVSDDKGALVRALADVRDEAARDAFRLSPVATTALGLLEGRVEYADDLRARVQLASEEDGTELLLRVAADRLFGRTAGLEELDPDVRRETELFVDGPAGEPRGPEQVLAYLLALQHPDLRVWLVTEMLQREDDRGVLWPRFLRGAALLLNGDLERADHEVTVLTRRAPGFAPGWGLAGELFRVAPPSDQRLLEISQRGWSSASRPEVAEARALLAEARSALARGDTRLARDRIGAAFRLAPEDSPIAYQLSLVELAEGRYGPALEALSRFLSRIPERARAAALPDVLWLLRDSVAAGHIDADTERRYVERLAELNPDNSLVTVRQAELEALSYLERNPVAGVFLAFRRLGEFRQRTGRAPIESLGPGALPRWHEFYLATAPERSEAFLREELAHDPRNPDLWAMLAESYYAQDRRSEARDSLDLLLSILPSERALRSWIRIEAENGAPVEDVRRASVALASLPGVEAAEAEVRYLTCVAQLNSARNPDPGSSIPTLEELWQERDELPLRLEARVGRSLGIALMRAGDQQQASRAQRVFEELVALPLQRDERRLYATLSRVGPSPTDVEILPKRARDEARTDDGTTERISRSALMEAAQVREAISTYMAALSAEERAVFSARLKGMSPEERAALAASLSGEEIAAPYVDSPEARRQVNQRIQAQLEKLPEAEAALIVERARYMTPEQRAELADELESGDADAQPEPEAPTAGPGRGRNGLAPADVNRILRGHLERLSPSEARAFSDRLRAMTPEERAELAENIQSVLGG